jgi:hypothetical protein
MNRRVDIIILGQAPPQAPIAQAGPPAQTPAATPAVTPPATTPATPPAKTTAKPSPAAALKPAVAVGERLRQPN